MTHSALLMEFAVGLLALVPADPALGHPGRDPAPPGHPPGSECPGVRRSDVRDVPDVPGARRASEPLALARPAAALARLGSLFSPANLWPAGRQVSIPALQKLELPGEGA